MSRIEGSVILNEDQSIVQVDARTWFGFAFDLGVLIGFPLDGLILSWLSDFNFWLLIIKDSSELSADVGL